MAVAVVIRSRLRNAELGVIDGYEFWDRVDFPVLVPQPDDTTYQVVGLERLDTIASNIYGDPTLAWVIALANDLELVPGDISPGDILSIPSPRYILGEVLR